MKYLSYLIGLLFLFGCNATSGLQKLTIQTENKEIQINIEIADEPEERTQGLMNRSSLPEKQGMLFIFEEEKVLGFWMKNTLIPLDMIFIDADKKIAHIEHGAIPCKADPCPVYSSNEKVKYVLELNGGFSEENSIKIGNNVEF